MSVDMTVEEMVKSTVIRILRKSEADFSTNASFADMDADSLDMVQVLVALEDAYNIEIMDEDLSEITNMGDFIAYVERKVTEQKQ